jgi:hypothetical protein
MPDKPIARLLADELNEGFREERSYQDDILDYLDEDGSVMDLSEHLGDVHSNFNGLAYDLAQTCEIAARNADSLDEARGRLRRELAHVEREFHGAARSVGATPDVLRSLRTDV